MGSKCQLAANIQCLHKVYAHNSFVLPAHEVDVSQILDEVIILMVNIQPDYPLILSKNKYTKLEPNALFNKSLMSFICYYSPH